MAIAYSLHPAACSPQAPASHDLLHTTLRIDITTLSQGSSEPLEITNEQIRPAAGSGCCLKIDLLGISYQQTGQATEPPYKQTRRHHV